MKFSEAKSKLKELARGKYHSISFEVSEYTHGNRETGCTLYIDGHSHATGYTWEEAFSALERLIEGAPVEEIPDTDPAEYLQAVGR